MANTVRGNPRLRMTMPIVCDWIMGLLFLCDVCKPRPLFPL